MSEQAAHLSPSPMRALKVGPYAATIGREADGSVRIRSNEALGPYPVRFTEHLLRWANERPDAVFLARREPGGGGAWGTVTYAQAWSRVRGLAQALLDRKLSVDRPLMVLSGNDIEFALLSLAAMHVGVAVAPISPAYSQLDPEASRVRHAVALLTPGMVFASDGDAFANSILQAVPPDVEVVLTKGALAGRPHTPYASLLNTEATPAVDAAHAAVTGDTVAKFLFTSGSTKMPKAVVNTHRMLSCNQQMNAQCYPFLQEEPPVLVDWLPWHHTAGGNNNFGLVLMHGGSLYIDEGKPTEEGIAETVRNLREVAPTMYVTVPKGLEALQRHMRNDVPLRERFFSRLRLIFPAGAALPNALLDALDRMAVETIGARIPMTMALGMTETAPFAISAHLPDWRPGVIGLPAPGVEVKLVPAGDKMEVRYRGPNVTPGYWRQPELLQESFDEEGFFCSGDAAAFIDEARPELGLRFNGRIAEDFKLVSGTFVNVGALRAKVIAAGAPHVQDIVVTGHDRDAVGMLVFLLPTATRLSASLRADATLAEIVADPEVRRWAQQLLDSVSAPGMGSSKRIVHAALMATPPSAACAEITDKGSINQRAVLKARAEWVEAMYQRPDDPRFLRASGE